MPLLEIHRHEASTAVTIEFSDAVASALGMKSYIGSVGDLKRVVGLLHKQSDEVGDPIILELFKPPAEEVDDDDTV